MRWFMNSNIKSGYLARKPNIYEIIRDKIQFLEIEPGANISESELSHELGVSRTPIRETLLQLSSEKLLEIYPQKGMFVSKIDVSYIEQLAYMRHILETHILSEMCQNMVKISDNFEKNLLLQKLSIKSRNIREYSKLDDEFHRILFSYYGHESIWDVIEHTRAHFTRYRILKLNIGDNMSESIKEHFEIIHCIEAGDIISLQNLLLEHHDCKLISIDQIREKYPNYFL